MRDYLATLREESYVMVKPGYTDSAAVAGGQRNPGSAADARHGAEEERKEETAAAQSQRPMKSHYVSDLQDGQAVTSLFLVARKEIRTSQRSGKSWLELALRDKTGSIPAKMWDNFETLAKTFRSR